MPVILDSEKHKVVILFTYKLDKKKGICFQRYIYSRCCPFCGSYYVQYLVLLQSKNQVLNIFGAVISGYFNSCLIFKIVLGS